MKSQKISNLVRLPEFAELLGEYRSVCAAYVHNDDLGDILIGNRNNKHDPLREGYIALPCGGLEEGESFEDAVIREIKEETYVDAEIQDSNLFSFIPDAPYLKEYGPVVFIINENGKAWTFARDSGIRLAARVFDLHPLTEPHETNSDLKNPRYEPLNRIIENQVYVMPEERFILDIIAEKRIGERIKDRILLDRKDFSVFMKEATLL